MISTKNAGRIRLGILLGRRVADAFTTLGSTQFDSMEASGSAISLAMSILRNAEALARKNGKITVRALKKTQHQEMKKGRSSWIRYE